MRPLISIVIPCYNDPEYIQEAINSAFRQTFKLKEIIVIDDGSSEETKTRLEEIKDKIDVLVTQENKGVSSARNKGISLAQGLYIVVLDSDDYLDESFCEKAVEIFKNKNNLNIVTSYARWFWSPSDFQIFKPSGGGLRNFLCWNASLCSMFKKSDWENCGGYDESMKHGFEDWEFYIRLHEKGGVTFVIPEVLFHYRKRKKSKTTEANLKKRELQEYIIFKHSELYKQNFDVLVTHLLKEMEKSDIRWKKLMISKEYKIGWQILLPLRKIKSLLMKSLK